MIITAGLFGIYMFLMNEIQELDGACLRINIFQTSTKAVEKHYCTSYQIPLGRHDRCVLRFILKYNDCIKEID